MIHTIRHLRAMGRQALSGGIAALLLLTAGVASKVQALNPWPDSDYLYKQYNNAMNYRLFVPKTYASNPTANFPLVIFVHGNGEYDNQTPFIAGNPNSCNSKQMDDNGQFAFVTTANQSVFPCFLALIQKRNPGTMTLPDAIAGMIDELATQYRIDLDRVVVTGLSGGGWETLQMAQLYPEKLAAVVPVCAVVPNGFAITNPRPAWFFHGNGDGEVPPYSAFVSSRIFSAAGGTPIFTMYTTNNHTIWGAVYGTPQLISWLAVQRRNLPSQNDPARVVITTPAANPASVATSTLTVSGSSSVQSGLSPQLTSVRYSKDSYSYEYGNNAASGTPSAWSVVS